ncbi:MAG TPA: transposase [Solirubrobacteraceae bacterium]|nr:transposase [Solirubrobacteraceae bacterium]
MPRKPRELVAGGVYHVYARGNNRQSIFLDDLDRRAYLRHIEHVVLKRAWLCLAYCLMPNHVHLLVETPQPDLAVGMHWLHGAYARRFNRRHRRVGHLFQGRYGAVRIEDDAQLWMTAAYIARNPVAAGHCREPEDWEWSSHAATANADAPPWLAANRLLEYLQGAAGGDPHERYGELTRR